jgi:hypothetical protein
LVALAGDIGVERYLRSARSFGGQQNVLESSDSSLTTPVVIGEI